MQVAGELVTALFKFIKAQHLLANAQRGLAAPGVQALLPQARKSSQAKSALCSATGNDTACG
ncbi:hypothetical protein PSYMO_29773 [Pseudomonas amygdali pv. mori str. 301020]|uniref:Uncharacterized protein n=1 Tax=Pseudomonas amygdali pv. mori str. 301020 TaxID=629261 RepID=A0A656GI25_PSEA0|nr:hypothetical protein PSYMO_29773 [Pseudomonas amygdali pv. mori str. 301020]